MRYSAVYFGNDGPGHIVPCYRSNFARGSPHITMLNTTTEYKIISIDNETDIFFTAYWMAIPETHPYYNYGLLVNRYNFGKEELIHVAVRKLYTLTKARSKPI